LLTATAAAATAAAAAKDASGATAIQQEVQAKHSSVDGHVASDLVAIPATTAAPAIIGVDGRKAGRACGALLGGRIAALGTSAHLQGPSLAH
jgi:hypothetical protein